MRWADFETVKELGRGATARVWLARRKSDGHLLCLKVFHPGLGEEAERRIVREGDLATELVHPNIVRVLGSVTEGHSAALALELLDGGNLETFQSALPYILPEVSVAIIVEVLRALEFAHGRGVIHRDLKPANVLMDQRGRVAVADFGLARVVGSQMTASVGLLGSVDYMAPEQVSGETASPASDLFSVAAILYFLVTGTRPFARPTPVATVAAIRSEDPEAPQRRNPKVSAALARIILQGLRKDPAGRFADAATFRGALEGYLAQLGLWPFVFGAWRRDPTAVTMSSLEVAAAHLIRHAEKALQGCHWGEFLEQLSHLSLKAPETPALARLTENYRKVRARKRRAAWFGWAGSSAAVVVVAGVVSALISPPKAATLTIVATPATVVPKPPQAPKVGKVDFQVGESVTVYWDGKKMDPKRRLTSEKLGAHWILLEREGFDPIRAKVQVRADRPTVIKVD